VLSVGRYGSFEYDSQHNSILIGLLAAETIVAGKSHDLWAIDTDDDSYQETATIISRPASKEKSGRPLAA